MDKNELKEAILNKEWNMFQEVQNVDGRASCQDDQRTFCIMRGAQFEAWNEDMLESYYEDLIEAEQVDRNLLSEKYAYMMEATFPEEFEAIRDMVPPVSDEKKKSIELILAIELRQTSQFRSMYPNIAKRGRPLFSKEDSETATSVETYTRGELSTYSEKTLKKYLLHICDMEYKHMLFPKIVMEATVRASGYLTLEEAERACGQN